MDTLKNAKKVKSTSGPTNIPDTSNPLFSNSKFDPDIQDVASDQEGDGLESDEDDNSAHVSNK